MNQHSPKRKTHQLLEVVYHPNNMKAYLVPHVPFMLPELGGYQLESYMIDIIRIFGKIKQEILNSKPKAILICSPHYMGSVFEIGNSNYYRGDFTNLGRSDIIDTRRGNIKMSNYLNSKGDELGFVSVNTETEVSEIDYGIMVPLRLIDPNGKIPIIPISVSMGSKKEHYYWGQHLFELLWEFEENVILIASTELTQEFQQEPSAFPSNSDMDKKYMRLVASSDLDGIEGFPNSYFANVENDLLPTCVLSGFGYKMKSEIMLYQGLIGCGCGFIRYEY